MAPHEELRVDILRYVGDELSPAQAEALRKHIDECVLCQRRLEQERLLSGVLRESRPLYAAPQTLRARVAERMARKRRNLLYRMAADLRSALDWRHSFLVAVAATLAVVFITATVRERRAEAFVDAALAAHREYVGGGLRLEIRSDNPQVVSSWVKEKVPFRFQLPSYQRTPRETSAYRLVGATLTHLQGSPAAIIAYAMANEKISLLAVSSESTVAAGGQETRSRGLTFHERGDGTFRIFTWTNHGVTYALVSSLATPGRNSCLVCHQNMADASAFQARTRGQATTRRVDDRRQAPQLDHEAKLVAGSGSGRADANLPSGSNPFHSPKSIDRSSPTVVLGIRGHVDVSHVQQQIQS
jgi:anti-sigma factor RsiW